MDTLSGFFCLKLLKHFLPFETLCITYNIVVQRIEIILFLYFNFIFKFIPYGANKF